MSDIKEFSFEFNRKNLDDVINIIKDLSKIDPMIKMKMDDEHVLFYTKAGKDNVIHALKSFMLPVQDFIIADDYLTIDFIIINGPNFIKNLDILNREKAINGKLTFKEKDKVASTFYISNEKIKVNFITGDYRMIKDITKGDIENKMDPANANFEFIISGDDFAEVKKLTALNKSETISLRVKKGKLEFFDGRKWSLHVCDLPTVDDETWSFNNKYLKSINPADQITIHMFDQFLLFKEDNVALMIGLELSEL
jgi:hypothetical protein